MTSQIYQIVPDPLCAEHVPPHGWRAVVSWVFPRLIRRPRFVWCHPDGVQLVCHPTTVKWLKTYLERVGHKYTQADAVIRPVENKS